MRPAAPTLCLLALAVLAGGCRGGVARGRVGSGLSTSGAGAGTGTGAGGPAAAPVLRAGEKEILVENRNVGRITKAEFAQFNAAWDLFVRRDKEWPAARDAWLARGGAAPYVLAENLLRYFWSATAYSRKDRKDIYRVADSARAAGEPAVGYFANVLVLDEWPLKEPVTIQVEGGEKKVVSVWVNDDVTRQHLAIVLAGIGAPAVPRLTSPAVLHAPSSTARRYAMYALGSIGSDPAVDALGSMLAAPDWQDRASAAKSLGFALRRNPRAKPLLEGAASDPDKFVRKKVEEALSGKSKSEF